MGFLRYNINFRLLQKYRFFPKKKKHFKMHSKCNFYINENTLLYNKST